MAQMGLRDGGDKFTERMPELIDILRCFGKVIGEVNLGLVHLADLVKGELPALVVFVDQSLDFDYVILFKAVGALLDVVPHLCLDGSGAVHQGEIQIGLAALFGLDLLVADDKAGGDYLVFLLCRVSNIKLFHEFSILGRSRRATGFMVSRKAGSGKQEWRRGAGPSVVRPTD